MDQPTGHQETLPIKHSKKKPWLGFFFVFFYHFLLLYQLSLTLSSGPPHSGPPILLGQLANLCIPSSEIGGPSSGPPRSGPPHSGPPHWTTSFKCFQPRQPPPPLFAKMITLNQQNFRTRTSSEPKNGITPLLQPWDP